MQLLALDLHERPGHPFVHFNLGMTFADADRNEEAVAALVRSLELADPRESQVRKAFALLVGSLAKLGRFEEARERCAEGLRHYPQDAELLFRSAMLAHHFGRLYDAERRYLAVLANCEERHFSSLDRGIVSYKARHNLAVVYAEMGDLPKAIEQWHVATVETPDYRDAWRGLGELLLREADVEALGEMVARLEALPDLRGLYLAWLSRWRKSSGTYEEANAALREAVAKFPRDVDVLRSWAQELFESGDLVGAEPPLRELLRLDPG